MYEMLDVVHCLFWLDGGWLERQWYRNVITSSGRKISYNSIWRTVCFSSLIRRSLHLLGGKKWSFLCLTYCLSYMTIISFKLIHSWCHFTLLLNFSDMIALRWFRRQFFTHRGSPPSDFNVTIRCIVSFILQPANFYPYSLASR